MEHLKTNPLIVDVQPLQLTEEILAQCHKRIHERMREENEQVNAYHITYRSQGHNVNGFLVEPKQGENLPCIIINRGGSKEFSTYTPVDVLNVLSHFASLGYVVVMSQLSGCAGSEGKDEVGGSELEDILILRELLAEHPRANVEKIGMYGASRGGMMTYLALAKVNWVKAAATRAGTANQFRNYGLRPSLKEFHRDCYDVDSEAEITKRSAVCWPEKFCKTTPLLIIHGTSDNRVSVLDSLELAGKLYEHKVPFRLNIFEGADHFMSQFRRDEWRAVEQWFERFLKNDEPLPNLEREPIN